MMRILIVLITVTSLLTGCNYNKSFKKDFTSGLTVNGDGLSCRDVYLSSGGEGRISRNTFFYGERISVNFDGMEGFVKKSGFVRPKISIVVFDKRGDILLQEDDLYKDVKKTRHKKNFALFASLLIGSPINSGSSYRLRVRVSDRYGKGAVTAEMPFTVQSSTVLKNRTEHATCNEIYLFDNENNSSVNSNHIDRSHPLVLVYLGLRGFSVEDSLVSVGLSSKMTDSNGEILMYNPDLAADQPINEQVFSNEFYATFNLGSKPIKNPVKMEFILWDKKGSAKIISKGAFYLD